MLSAYSLVVDPPPPVLQLLTSITTDMSVWMLPEMRQINSFRKQKRCFCHVFTECACIFLLPFHSKIPI